MKITTNSILSFANEFKSKKWGAALDEAIEILENQKVDNIKVSKFEKSFSKNRDMKLLEYSDKLDGFDIDIKYYLDKEFDTFYYSLEKDLESYHKIILDKLNNSDELTEEEIKKNKDIINSNEFQYQKEQIAIAKSNREIISFDDYSVTLGLYFFNKDDRNEIQKILIQEYGEYQIIDGHSVWRNNGHRLELAPAMLTFVPKIEELK